MKFSSEEVYILIGQYDEVVGVTFRKTSEAFNQFGDFLVGVFVYTQKEREELERVIGYEPIPRSTKMLKFREVNGDISQEKRNALLEIGFDNNDILILDIPNHINNNKFVSKEKRTIGNKIEIPVDFHEFDEEDFKVRYYNMRLKTNGILIEEELDEYYGILLNRTSDPKFRELVIDNSTGAIKKNNVKFYYLLSKNRKGLINELEKSELEALLSEREKNKNQILIREIKRSGLKLKETGQEYSEQILTFLRISQGFKTEPITIIGKPIYWDFTTLCHIYLRHVSETQIGGQFKGKSILLYDLMEIRKVIRNVLESCMNEIQIHFKNNPTKSFQRYNAQSIYYNGDYYRFQIEQSGRLDYFHNYEKNIG